MIFTGDIALPYANFDSFDIPKDLLENSWFGNLEGSLVAANALKENIRGVFNDLDAIKELCVKLPFKAFGIANNHLLDAANVNTTLNNLQLIGVDAVGGGGDINAACRPLLIADEDGTEYQILAFGWENIQCKTATIKKQGVNPYSRDNVLRCVDAALKKNYPVVCFMHWNYELEAYPQPYDRQLAMDLIDKGVSAVVGCHAHRTQPIEFYKGKPIVYGLGNFLFRQGYYFDGKLQFPRLCEEEYAFEITKEGYKIHHFIYNQKENVLVYIKSEEVSENKSFAGKAVFSEMTSTDYETWFDSNRVQKKLLPIFHSKESAIGYAVKTKWIKFRGELINILTKVNLKSANRSNK